MWLHQHKLLPPTDQTVEVLIGVRVQNRLGSSAAEPDVNEHQVIRKSTAEEELWQLPLIEHWRREGTDHIDVVRLVFL